MNYKEIYNEAFNDELDKLASGKERLLETAEGAGVVGAGAGGLTYGLSRMKKQTFEALPNPLKAKVLKAIGLGTKASKVSKAGKAGLTAATIGAALGGISGYMGAKKKEKLKVIYS